MHSPSLRAAYARSVRLLPASARVRLRETTHSLLHPTVGERPRIREMDGIRLEPWKFGAKAAACFSADFELAWAARYVGLGRALEEAARTRAAFPDLLSAFDRFDLPATWAVVGHLLLDSCGRPASGGLPHPEMPRPGFYRNRYWTFDAGDWYDHDPGTSLSADPEWYAPDLVSRILASPVRHEIGCHSFSHTDFSEAHCPPSVAQAELERCQREAARFGVRLRSFVFPANFAGNFSALASSGFTAFRGPPERDLAYPTKRSGLWNVQGSIQLFDPEADYGNRVPRYLEAALRSRTAFHLNFHPSLLDPRMVADILEPVLRVLKDREREGELWIATMAEIASFCEARQESIVHARSSSDTRRAIEIDWRLAGPAYPDASVALSVPWSHSLPSCEIDGAEVRVPSPTCFAREGRLYVTIERPQRVATIRSR